MLSHIPFLPVAIPLIAGFTILIAKPLGEATQRKISILSLVILILVSMYGIFHATVFKHTVYTLGNWEAPFGIVLLLDKLSIIMVAVTAVLALGALLYSISENIDKKGAHFHTLFQLQIFGINGAFLTGDLFNLFVFFEILLLASYSLLLHGRKKGRTLAGLHYVIINLVGSTLFLFAVGTLYGILGTLNIAHLGVKIATLNPDNVNVVAGAGLLLLVVFGLKAAMFPLFLWLPNAYSKTSAPIAALFAIMTKIGIYAIIRVHGTLFGADAGELAFYHTPWVLNIGLITLLLATLGAISAKELRSLVAYLVLASVSSLLISIGIGTQEALSATVYYMIHSTFAAAGMFLLADIIVKARGGVEKIGTKTPLFHYAIFIGSLYFFFAVAMAGLPPLSGFFGKLMILSAAIDNIQTGVIFTIILLSSLLIVITLAKTGSSIFYDTDPEKERIQYKLKIKSVIPIFILGIVAPIMVIFANPITEFTNQVSQELMDTTSYIHDTLDNGGKIK